MKAPAKGKWSVSYWVPDERYFQVTGCNDVTLAEAMTYAKGLKHEGMHPRIRSRKGVIRYIPT